MISFSQLPAVKTTNFGPSYFVKTLIRIPRALSSVRIPCLVVFDQFLVCGIGDLESPIYELIRF